MREPKLKKNKTRFVPFGTNRRLECVGRSKVKIKAVAGAVLKTIAYVIRGVNESLLGRTDAVRLGIIEFHPEGLETIRRLTDTKKKPVPDVNQIVSGGMSQRQIDEKMEGICSEFSGLFVGLGRAQGVDPIHIVVDDSAKPVQKKRRPIPLKYVERFESLLDDLKTQGVVSSPLDHRLATNWIHNLVIA